MLHFFLGYILWGGIGYMGIDLPGCVSWSHAHISKESHCLLVAACCAYELGGQCVG